MRLLNLYFVLILILTACAKEEVFDENDNRFPVLTYNSEISETLTLDKSSIDVVPSKEINYWFQYNLNPRNDLGHFSTKADFNKKTKIISGKSGPSNIIQPIFFDDIICQVKNTGHLECIDNKSKNTILKIDLKKEDQKKYEILRGGIANYGDNIVFVDAYGQVKLINIIQKEEVWSKTIDFPILSPPLVYRDYIYFISADNRIFSISIDSGELAWTFQTISESKKNFFTASPVAYENIIIAPFSNGELIAFNYENGRPIWSENVTKISQISNFDIKDISASPVVSGNNVYTLSSKGKLISVNIINGKRDWAIDLSGYRTPIVSGNQLYVINEDGKLICLEKNSGEIFWITDLSKHKGKQNLKNLNLWLGPYLINNLLYNLSIFGELKIVSPTTGDVLSTRSIGVTDILVPPLILKDAIYVADEKSNVFKFE